jgi:phosphate transport system substrate-binding protein
MGAATLTSIAGNPRLRALAIDGKAATVANIADGSYPLYTPLYLVTNPRSPKAAQVQAFIDFMQSEPAKAALRKHLILPYQDGIALASMDAARRRAIYAEVGVLARDVAHISAPGATYAARAAIAPTSPDTLAARIALENRQARQRNDARLQKISGSASAAGQSPRTYTVSKGDTLELIARHHSVEVSQLRQWNHLHSDKVKRGQVLIVGEN